MTGKKSFLWVLSFLTLVTFCFNSMKKTPSKKRVGPYISICEFIDYPFEKPNIYKIGKSRDLIKKLKKYFGTPASTRVSGVSNIHNMEVTDIITELNYNDYRFMIYHATQTGYDILTNLVLLNRFSGLKYNIVPRMKPDEVEEIFGTGKLSSGVLKYSCGDTSENNISFYFLKSSLSKIEIDYGDY